MTLVLCCIFLSAHSREKLLCLILVARKCQQCILVSASFIYILGSTLGKRDEGRDTAIALGHDIIFAMAVCLGSRLGAAVVAEGVVFVVTEVNDFKSSRLAVF